MERSADWIRQARFDLQLARNALEDGFYEWASFAAHQAAQKAIKAALQARGADAWGHSLPLLLEGLAVLDPVPAELLATSRVLNKAYIPTRYPDAHLEGTPHEQFTRAEAERNIADAERLVAFCADRLPAV